jgi:hypothetical protein
MEVKRNGREPILQAAGYAYNFDRLAYYNRGARKVFSVEWLREHTDEEIHQAVEAPNDSGDWLIYADPPPSKRVVNEFLAEIDA